MEVIKRKINLEDFTDREDGSKSWGVMTASTFYIKILLTQKMDDTGLFTDIEYFPYDSASSTSNVDYSILIDKLSSMNVFFPFMNKKPAPIFTKLNTPHNLSYVLKYPTNKVEDYFAYFNLQLSAFTESKIEDLKSYNSKLPYRTNFDIKKEDYLNYKNNSITGVDRIKIFGEPKVYVFDTVNDGNLGTETQTTGLRYTDYTGQTRDIIINSETNETRTIPLTIVNYVGEGFNDTNTSINGLTKEEYLFGMIYSPEVFDDVFIERGVNNVFENHLRLAEVKSLGEVATYNGGYFNVTRQ